mgnify:CR=1 FL=1
MVPFLHGVSVNRDGGPGAETNVDEPEDSVAAGGIEEDAAEPAGEGPGGGIGRSAQRARVTPPPMLWPPWSPNRCPRRRELWDATLAWLGL